jgi:hypothetical protein
MCLLRQQINTCTKIRNNQSLLYLEIVLLEITTNLTTQILRLKESELDISNCMVLILTN